MRIIVRIQERESYDLRMRKRERENEELLFSCLNSEPITIYLKRNQIRSRQRRYNKEMEDSTSEIINKGRREMVGRLVQLCRKRLLPNGLFALLFLNKPVTSPPTALSLMSTFSTSLGRI